MNKREKSSKFYILLSFTIIWTVFIWGMSLRPAVDSTEMSKGILEVLLDVFLPGIGDTADNLSEAQTEWLHFLLRKCAHFAEYFLLGLFSFLCCDSISSGKKTVKRIEWLAAFGYCVFIAVLDETIQLFIPGRMGQVRDVVLDCFGAMSGIVFAMGIVKIRIGKFQNNI